MSSRLDHCGNSLSWYDECRLSAKRAPTLRPRQPTWTVSPPVGCYCLHPLLPLITINQSEGWCSFYHPTEGKRLSQPRWLAAYWDGLPTNRRSPIPVLTWPNVEQLCWPTCYHIQHYSTRKGEKSFKLKLKDAWRNKGELGCIFWVGVGLILQHSRAHTGPFSENVHIAGNWFQRQETCIQEEWLVIFGYIYLEGEEE